jgi:TDG/mug DNA glycosylase family protein
MNPPDERPWRPTREQLAAARGRTVPDVVNPGLDVLFCGINPGLYSGAVGHHFARPGNRFWKSLHLSGFTDEVLSPFQERTLLGYCIGITNLVERSTASADELSSEELRLGAAHLEAKVCRLRPKWIAFLGMGAFRSAFARADAALGPQPETICGSSVWLLPNPSGRGAHYQVAELARLFGKLRRAAGGEPIRRRARPSAPKERPAPPPSPVRRRREG